MAETMAAAPASGVKIELPRLMAIRGRVVDTHGNPVRSFAIEARSEIAWQENREDIESDDG